MNAIRRIYESVTDSISIPPEWRRRRVEVIILPLDDGDSATSGRDDAEVLDGRRTVNHESWLKSGRLMPLALPVAISRSTASGTITWPTNAGTEESNSA
ncbi:MAG: hypothetical protein KIT57_14180 [Blastocatellales bacterium]|nr:hypothetical protein [Blastocatellales bacterium]